MEMTMTTIAVVLIIGLVIYILREEKLIFKKKIGPKSLSDKVIAAAPDLILLLNREAQIVEVVNYDSARVPLSVEKAKGEPFINFIDESYQQEVMEKIANAFYTKEVQEVDFICKFQKLKLYYEGGFKRIDKNTLVYRGRDTTRAKLYELELIKSKKETEHTHEIKQVILQNLESGFLYINTDFSVKFENLNDKKSLGLQANPGEFCYQRIKGKNIPCEGCIAQKALQNKKMVKENVITENNTCLEVTAIPISNWDGEYAGVVLKYKNVTNPQKESFRSY